MTFDAAVAVVEAARTPADLFGRADPARTYRRLSRVLHPDVAPADRAATATAAFARLAELWSGHEQAQVITTARHRYVVAGPLGTDDPADLAQLYQVRHTGGEAVLKVARAPADNDLLAREAEALTRLAREGDPKFHAYTPRLIETFTLEDPATGHRRRANVQEHCAGFVSLAQVASAFGDGVDPRDVAWMWRRLLVALGAAHRVGLVHGAVLPEHVLIHPEEHGLVLVDWCYAATRSGQHLPALVARYRAAYPPEVTARQPATPATDLYLASGLMLRVMGARAQPALRRFARGCRLAAPRLRPQDAWALLAELDALLADLYGRRRFRPFALPT